MNSKTQLRRYLQINSGFSLFSGLTLLIGANSIAELFQINNDLVLPIIGAQLLAFAGFTLYTAYLKIENRLLVNIISLLDLLWVIASILVIAFQAFDLSTIAYWTIAVVALDIAFLSERQYKYNKVVLN